MMNKDTTNKTIRELASALMRVLINDDPAGLVAKTIRENRENIARAEDGKDD